MNKLNDNSVYLLKFKKERKKIKKNSQKINCPG